MSQKGAVASMLLILPFGLALARGATFQIDHNSLHAAMAFQTCLPVGCIVQTTLAAKTLEELRHGKMLNVHVVANAGRELLFTLPLPGWPEAFARLKVLLTKPPRPNKSKGVVHSAR